MIPIIELPEILERKLEKSERHEIIIFINELFANYSTDLKEDVIQICAEKFERRLSEEISGLRTELSEKISLTEIRLSEKIAQSETRMSEKIAASKTEMIKWMFIFWMGSVLTIVGAMAGLLKLAGVF